MVEMKNQWYECDGNELARELFAVCKYLDTEQNYRNEADLRNLRLYGNLDILGLDLEDYARPVSSTSDRLTLNVIQNQCDTITNKISKNKPRVSFLTTGGTGSQIRKSKLLTQFIDGMFYMLDFYELAQRVFKDSTIFGTGAVRFYVDYEEERVCAEKVFPNEIIVDDVQGMNGSPRELHLRRWVDKQVLANKYKDEPEKYEAILKASASGLNYKPLTRRSKSQVFVLESWRLPSSKDAKDGLYVVAIENCLLEKEEYNKTYFPFAFLRWNERPLGFFGQGLSEQLTGIQIEINKLLKTVQLSFNAFGVPRVLVEESSKVVDAHIDNRIGNIIKYRGTRPEFNVSQSIGSDVIAQIDRLYQRSFEISGVSQFSAQSKKPEGVDSAVAMREFNDIETDRFILTGQRYENFFVDSAKIIIDLTKDLQESGVDVKVRSKGKKFVEQIKWADINVQEDDFVIQPFPTGYLGNSPSGRLQKIQELVNGQFIPREEALSLLDMPDLEAHLPIQVVKIRNILRTIEKIVESGKYIQPEPYQDLKYGQIRFQAEYLYLQDTLEPSEEKDKTLENLRTWIEQAQKMDEKAEKAMLVKQAKIQAEAQAEAQQAQGQVLQTQAQDQAINEEMAMANQE